MVYETSYNPDVDLYPVEDNLALDISSALESGVVLDTGVESFYNGIEDSSSIVGRVRDAFEVIDAQRAVLASAKLKSKSSEANSSSVSNPASSASD